MCHQVRPSQVHIKEKFALVKLKPCTNYFTRYTHLLTLLQLNTQRILPSRIEGSFQCGSSLFLPSSEFSGTRYRVLGSDWVTTFPLHFWYIPPLFATLKPETLEGYYHLESQCMIEVFLWIREEESIYNWRAEKHSGLTHKCWVSPS